MRNLPAILFWRFVQWRLRKGYGADCPTRDRDEFLKGSHPFLLTERCPSCLARDVIGWVDGHISLLQD